MDIVWGGAFFFLLIAILVCALGGSVGDQVCCDEESTPRPQGQHGRIFPDLVRACRVFHEAPASVGAGDTTAG